jgi:hypothetical protein
MSQQIFMKAVNDQMVSSSSQAAVEMEQQESDGDRKKRMNEVEHEGQRHDAKSLMDDTKNDDDDDKAIADDASIDDDAIGEQSINPELSQLSYEEREEIIDDTKGVPTWSLAEELNKLSLVEREDILHEIQDVPTWSLSEELNKLSLVEREDILFDVHGVSDNAVDETPELISRTSKEMNEFLKTFKTDAYALAESQSPEYLKSAKFRLMFLRADNFDAPNAARQMLQFLEHKLELFGPTKLCKEITLDDLTPEDMRSLENGPMQLMPVRDPSDRAIFVHIANYMKYKTIENLVSRKTDSTRNKNCSPDHLFRFHLDSNTASSSFVRSYI